MPMSISELRPSWVPSNTGSSVENIKLGHARGGFACSYLLLDCSTSCTPQRSSSHQAHLARSEPNEASDIYVRPAHRAVSVQAPYPSRVLVSRVCQTGLPIPTWLAPLFATPAPREYLAFPPLPWPSASLSHLPDLRPCPSALYDKVDEDARGLMARDIWPSVRRAILIALYGPLPLGPSFGIQRTYSRRLATTEEGVRTYEAARRASIARKVGNLY